VPTASHPPAAERFGHDKSQMCLHCDCEAHRHDRIEMNIPLNWKFCKDSKNVLQNEIWTIFDKDMSPQTWCTFAIIAVYTDLGQGIS